MPLKRGHFRRCQIAPVPRLERTVREWTDACSNQRVDRVSDRLEHPAHLAIPPFRDHQPHDGLGLAMPRIQDIRTGRECASPVEGNAAAQPSQGIRVGHAGDVGLVRALHAMPGVRQHGREVAVVGQQQEALGLVVEPAHWIDVLLHLADEVDDRAAPLGIAQRRHDTARLVQQDVAAAGVGLDAPAVHPDIVTGRVGLGAKFAHGLAVDGHPAVDDERFSRAARGDASPREYFLQTFFHEVLPGRPFGFQVAGCYDPMFLLR